LDTEENFSCLKLKKISIFGFRWRTYFGILKVKFQISGRWLLASISSSTLNCTFFHSQFLLSISDLFLNNFSLYNAPPINSHDWGISLYPSTASNGGVEQNFELWRPIYIYIELGYGALQSTKTLCTLRSIFHFKSEIIDPNRSI
jgi:hypothetical protein